MKFLFYYNNYERERLIFDFIQEELTKICPDMEFERYAADSGMETFYSVLKYNPDVVFTFPITTEYQAVQYTYLKYLTRAYIVSFTTEGLLKVEDDMLTEGDFGRYAYGENVVDKYINWGKKAAELFKASYIKEKRIKKNAEVEYYGYPLYEVAKLRGSLQNKYSEMIKNSQAKRNILILTGFDYADYTEEDILNAQDLIPSYCDAAEKAKLLQKIKEDVNGVSAYRTKYINLIKRLADKYEEYNFYIKLHPHELKNYLNSTSKMSYVEDFSNYDNVFVILENVPVSSLLVYSDSMIHYGSTVYMEAYIYKIPEIYLVGEGFLNLDIESQYKFSIDDTEKIVDFLGENICYNVKDSISNYIKAWVNYDENEPYEPSKKIAQSIKQMLEENKRTRVRCNDLAIVEYSRYASEYRRGLTYRAIKDKELRKYIIKIYRNPILFVKDLLLKFVKIGND